MKYFKDIGMWFLPSFDDGGTYEQGLVDTCNAPQKMAAWLNASSLPSSTVGDRGSSNSILDRCCLPGRYWTRRSSRPSDKS